MANVVFRTASAVAGLVFTLLAVGFFAGWTWVEQLWPFILDETPGTHADKSRMSQLARKTPVGVLIEAVRSSSLEHDLYSRV